MLIQNTNKKDRAKQMLADLKENYVGSELRKTDYKSFIKA